MISVGCLCRFSTADHIVIWSARTWSTGRSNWHRVEKELSGPFGVETGQSLSRNLHTLFLSDRRRGDPAIPGCADEVRKNLGRRTIAGRSARRSPAMRTGRWPSPISRISCPKRASGISSNLPLRSRRFLIVPATNLHNNPNCWRTGRSMPTGAVRDGRSRSRPTRPATSRGLEHLPQNFYLRMTCIFIISSTS